RMLVSDGSSDVCCSDLVERCGVNQDMLRHLLAAGRSAFERHQQPGLHLRLGASEFAGCEAVTQLHGLVAQHRQQFGGLVLPGPRSEERRVGKEESSAWS